MDFIEAINFEFWANIRRKEWEKIGFRWRNNSSAFEWSNTTKTTILRVYDDESMEIYENGQLETEIPNITLTMALELMKCY